MLRVNLRVNQCYSRIRLSGPFLLYHVTLGLSRVHPNIAPISPHAQVPISLHLPRFLLRSSRSLQICDGIPRMSSHSALPSRSQNRPLLETHRGIQAILLTPIYKPIAIEYPSDLREPLQMLQQVRSHTNSLPRNPDIKISPLTELTGLYALAIKMYPPILILWYSIFPCLLQDLDLETEGRRMCLPIFRNYFTFVELKNTPAWVYNAR